MPRFAANLNFLFTDVPYLDRFERAAQAGFSAVELFLPYPWPVAEIRARLDHWHLQAVLQNLPAGDWDAGERGLACLPQRSETFRASVQLGMRYATELGVGQINCLAGIAPTGLPAPLVRQTLVDNLRFAAAQFRQAGIKLLLEPINSFDMPGYYIHYTAHALDILDEVGADNAFLQYDIYHAQRMEGELAATLQKHLARIGHMQLADNPGRHEPGTGEINYAFLFSHLDRLGYAGWMMEALKQGADALFILLGGIMVLAMHAGFAFLGAGHRAQEKPGQCLVKILVDFRCPPWCISWSATAWPMAPLLCGRRAAGRQKWLRPGEVLLSC
jgi:hydroxypyruvate isomerase